MEQVRSNTEREEPLLGPWLRLHIHIYIHLNAFIHTYIYIENVYIYRWRDREGAQGTRYSLNSDDVFLVDNAPVHHSTYI